MRLRAYRALLWLFPREVREERGAHMERLFRDMCAEWEEEGRGLGPGFWLSIAADTARAAAGEWLSQSRDVTRSLAALTLGELMQSLFADVRFAIRQLVRQPMYSLTIVLLMTVGIAGNAAVFRIFNGLFLRPLPFESADRLVDLDETAPQWDLEFLNVAYRDFDTWRAENTTFDAMAVYDGGGGNFVADGAPRRVTYLQVTHDMDDVLGIEPVMGRFIGPEEDQPDGPRAALLSQGFWEQEYGSDPDVLGSTFTLNGYTIEVIGVLPPEARFAGEVDFWIPLRQDRSQWQGWGLNGIGRMRPGVTIEQARADLLAIHKAMIDDFEVNEISSPVVHSLRDRYLGDYRLGSGFLLGAVAVVLLIACANIAGLMSARSIARGPEMSVRLALGAPRARIVRQLLTESLVLAAVGAAAGTALGVWGSNALVAAMADQFPRWITFDLDARFLAFALGVTVLAALVFGLAPALQASARGAGRVTSRSTATASRRRGMSLLVSGEVALALALLVVGGLSMLDVQRLGRADPGFEAEGIVSYALTLPSVRYEDGDAVLAFTDEYLARLEAIPGVEHATVASTMPLSGHWGWFFAAEGAPPRAEDEANPVVLNRVVSPSYFDALGVRLTAGRTFDDFDGREEGAQVVVVNQTFVRTHLAHLADPIGARIHPGTDAPEAETDGWMTVVGVTRDVMHYGVDEEMRPGVYQPLRQLPRSGFTVGLKIRGDAAPALAAARALTVEMDPELPVYNVQTMTEQLEESLWVRRASSWLIGAFSTVALLLAVAGIYGVISYTVGQRTQEISIRMAMGAQQADVLRQVVRQGMGLVVIGAVVGLLLSFAGAGVVSGILVGVRATEPVVYGGVTLLLLAVAAAANYVPARRAAALDPMKALRGE